MRLLLLLLALPVFAQDAALDLPKNIRVSTWVREDIFAGFIDNQMAPFERGACPGDNWLKRSVGHGGSIPSMQP